MQVLVLDAHPRPDAFGAALATAYRDGATRAGHDVQLVRLADLEFDPLLRQGYQGDQQLEPDLARVFELILAADHLAVAWPLWWGSTPALLKGLLDRTLLPGTAFRYRGSGLGIDRLLTGRSARLLVTMDTPPWADRYLYLGAGVRQVKARSLEFCGIRPVKVTRFGSVRTASVDRRAAWLVRAERLGAAERPPSAR